MLRLSGKMLYDYDNALVGDKIKIFYTPTDQRYIIIYNSKPYDLVKEGSFLVWDIPSTIFDDPIKIKVQVMDAITNNTEYITNELTVKRNIINPNTNSNNINYDSDYPVYSMIDEGSIIHVDDRKIIMPSVPQTIVANDSVSQLLSFEMDRYYDNIDRSQKACGINFRNANKDEGKAIVVNFYKTEKKIYFSWLLDSNVTAYPGTVDFAIEFVGHSESGQTYSWNSKADKMTVEESLVVNTTIVAERYPTIIEDIQIQLVNANERLIQHDTDAAAHIDIREDIDEINASIDELSQDKRNFITEPIDLSNEVTGTLSIDKIDGVDNFVTKNEVDEKIGIAFQGISLTQLKADIDALKAIVDGLA